MSEIKIHRIAPTVVNEGDKTLTVDLSAIPNVGDFATVTITLGRDHDGWTYRTHAVEHSSADPRISKIEIISKGRKYSS